MHMNIQVGLTLGGLGKECLRIISLCTQSISIIRILIETSMILLCSKSTDHSILKSETIHVSHKTRRTFLLDKEQQVQGGFKNVVLLLNESYLRFFQMLLLRAFLGSIS